MRMLRHSICRRVVDCGGISSTGSGNVVAYKASANETSVLRRFRLGRIPGGSTILLPTGYHTRSSIVGCCERNCKCMRSIDISAPPVRVSLSRLRRGK